MFNRSTISAMLGGLALGAGLAVALMANAQPHALTAPVAGQTPAAVATPPAGETFHLTTLNADTFVTVKDHGDAQTISVFKVDGKGMNHLSHKAKFFY